MENSSNDSLQQGSDREGSLEEQSSFFSDEEDEWEDLTDSEEEAERQERLEQEVRELEQKLKIETVPQRQQPHDISELTDEQHDELVLYNLNDEEIKQKISTKLSIATIVDSIGSFVAQKYNSTIKEIEKNKGSYAALKELLKLETLKKLKPGWSRQLIKFVSNNGFNAAEELLKPKQHDLDEFVSRNGIPRNSLLGQLAEKLGKFCSILVSPMGKNDEDSQVVPIVHPQLCVIEDHFRRNTVFADGRLPAEIQTNFLLQHAQRVSFQALAKSNVQTTQQTNKFELLLQKHHGLSFFLIGPAGSGKTTLTKRITKTWIEEKKMAFLIPFAQIDKDERLNLKYLLTKFICRLHNVKHDPSEEEIDQSFHWILNNQDKCLLILDGLDQAGFEIPEKLIKANINDELMPCDLLALILSRKFLPKVRLVLSTRPHSIANLDPATQPQIIVFLNDMLSSDAEKLMNHYLEHGVASKIIENLRIKSPRIHQLIFNPLFLRLIVMLNNEVGDDVWAYVNTTAKLFFEVIERLQRSAHHECGLDVDDVRVMNDKLARMAFYKTMERSVVFTQADLERNGLSGDKVQDLLFGVMQRNTALLVGLMMVFYFNHQSTQEFFCARYALEKLAVGEFKEFVGKLFSRHEIFPGYGYFALVRVLIIGCINEMKPPLSDEVLEKKIFFVKSLCDHIREFSRNSGCCTIGGYTMHPQNKMMTDCLDIRDEGFIKEIQAQLNDIQIRFPDKNDVPNQEGLFHFVRHFVSKIDYIELNRESRWSTDELRRLFQVIKASTVKVRIMKVMLGGNIFLHIDDIFEILPHIQLLELNIIEVSGDVRRQFCNKVEEKVINFDTFQLQTEVVEVFVLSRSSNEGDRFPLHVALRRGKFPEFKTTYYPTNNVP